MMRALLLIFAFLGLILGACGNSNAERASREKPLVAVTVEPQRQIVDALAGDAVEVLTVLDRGANPETFEPSLAKRAALDRADAFLILGGILPFEQKLAGTVSPSVHREDVAQGIELVYGTHSHGDHSGDEEAHFHSRAEADPHLWTSVRNAAMIARNTARTLKAFLPGDSALIEQRLDSLLQVYAAMDSAYVSKLAAAPSRTFAVWHPSLSYFARDYALNQLALGQEHKELSALRLRQLVDSARQAGAQAFFFQREFDSRQAVTANERIGSRLVSIQPMDYDWQAQLDSIVNSLM